MTDREERQSHRMH
ncbi:hypothetical protein CSHISOI_08258 [Colletotrichum shisoi]|uniref:Uncharacterized protein n=1 Tax=Colletotrichum shisoi TaxID=2078593 RepID=A0A5Q4BKN1_9PEZI|nr:hypothetical protein CSHISOI_08258 [Colletotrichum shisoi]